MKSPVIFIVDPNPIHRNLIKYHLNVNRYSDVQIFHSADECLYRLRKTPSVDFIVTDFAPHHHLDNGFLNTVRTQSNTVKVIFFAISDDPILAMRLLDAGAADYIVKTSKLEIGINELIKNIKFLTREVKV